MSKKKGTGVAFHHRRGCIGNSYGDLQTGRIDGVPHWGIDDYDGITRWEEISEELYQELRKHENKGITKQTRKY